ncbi:MAG: glycosyl hydrolase [Gammaproteobacteria bacterium]|nr:glycosyl hydrolase [Gammaproteobacteria bacterium]
MNRAAVSPTRLALLVTSAAALCWGALYAPRAGAAPPAFRALTGKLAWRNIGPYIGGRVVAVAGVAKDRNLAYMGAVDGGVWKSTDAGTRWTNITDGRLPSSSDSIGAIAVSASDPKVLYVGTGESDIRGDMITGDGVFKSTDGGSTWSHAGLADTHTIGAIVIDPRDPNVVYAASMGHVFKSNPERGVFKSTDGGKSWSKVLYVDDRTGAIDLVMDPGHPGTLYAAMWQAYRTPWHLEDGGPGSGLYKSTDGGAHWTEISRNSGYPHGVLGRIGVSVAASDPRIVYSIVQARGGGVFRSEDGGEHWKRVNANWSLRQRAFYYMSIYADPTDPDTVYVPNVDALWVSHDGGRNFAKLHTPHGDNHIVWINPADPRTLIEGNDGGATISIDGGKTWSSEHNQPTGQFYHVAVDGEFPYHVYGAQQDEGAFEGPSASPGGAIPLSAWHRVAYGESTFVAPQPGHADTTFGSGYYSIFLRYDMATGEYRDVSPWPDYQEGASAGELKFRFGWTHPIVYEPDDPRTLLIASQYVLKSSDGGRTWTRISPDLTRNDPATERPSGGPVDLDQSGAELFPDIAALASSPLDSRVIWAGSADGLVHLTTDGGAHWQSVTPPDLPQSAEISSIEASHDAPGTAYLTASRYMWDDFHPYVFQTTDYGQHWTRITDGLADTDYAFVVRQDPDVPQLLVLGTKNSVYASLDGGAHWQSLRLNLPHVQVRDLTVDPRQGEIVIATHGRAFWILDDLSLIEQLARQSDPSSSGVRVFAPQTAWLSHAYGVSPMYRFMSAAGRNPPFGATVYFDVPKSYDGKQAASLTFSDSAGHVVRRYDLHIKVDQAKPSAAQRDNMTPTERKRAALDKLTAILPGMNRLVWNLRYGDATEVAGFEPPIAAGGLPDEVSGPLVAPGRYTVTFDYDGHSSTRAFRVALDPRLHPPARALENRLALELRIHDALDALDRTLNRAIDLRTRLNSAVTAHHLRASRARPAITELDHAIDGLVQLRIQSSEGSLLHETRLRSHLAYLAADIELAYSRPTPAQYAVFDTLNRRATEGERQLNAAIAVGDRLL